MLVLRPPLPWLLLPALPALLALAACGGGDPDRGDEDRLPSVELRLTEAVPLERAGSLSATGATDASTERRPADAVFAQPYCLVRYRNLVRADGAAYDLAIAFSVADHRVLALTLRHGASAWFVASFNPGAAQASVDLRRRLLTLRQARSTQGDQVGWQVTMDGHASLPPAPLTPDCG